MSRGVYRLVRGRGMGGLMCPPGHPNLTYEVRGGSTARKLIDDPHTLQAVDSSVTDETLPAEVRRQAKGLMESAELVRSELWERNVYGYYRNCYSPDGVSRSVERVDRSGPPEHHLGYLRVKSYFPDAEPRLDLIEDPAGGYGQKPCLKCGTSLQYEARVDRFAEPISCKLACPRGGEHEIPPIPGA